jgi:hypothetical protein
MNTLPQENFILPRPVGKLPEYAHAKARQALVEKITAAFGLSAEAASAIANSVVDPAAVRKSIGEPDDPHVEEISVPGGTLLGIRTSAWARRIVPDPRNPRVGPSRRHPFAVEPGTSGEDAKFRPVPEPRSRDGAKPETAELCVDVESSHHLTWASQQAKAYVLAENNWSSSIASQGVMEAVWLVATTYQHADGTASVTAMTTVEGSSRITAGHDLLGIRSADVPYDDNESRLRAHIRRLNDSYEKGPSDEDLVPLRCEIVPALILVGFRRHSSGNTGFPTAVKSLVALRHVDYPKPWGEGPENESLADEVLDELYRGDLISVTDRAYFAGSCTRAEARAAHLSDDPAVRAARIVHLFSNTDERIKEAIRIAVTSQSTRKRITPKLCDELATALILRATAGDPAKADQVRRYMRHAFGTAVHREPWKSTDRATAELINEAMEEVRGSIGAETATDPGPASLELAVRAAYPLVISGRLNADRGSQGNPQPDRRHPGEVLDSMRRGLQGIHQLGQALRDFQTGPHIRAVDEEGQIKKLADGSTEQMVNDVYLRGEFPPPGKAKARRIGNTPSDRYENCLSAFSEAAQTLRTAFAAIGQVIGDDGRPLVEARGAEPRACEEWRSGLRNIEDELIIWSRTFQKAFGSKPEPRSDEFEADDDERESDERGNDEYDDLEGDQAIGDNRTL